MDYKERYDLKAESCLMTVERATILFPDEMGELSARWQDRELWTPSREVLLNQRLYEVSLNTAEGIFIAYMCPELTGTHGIWYVPVAIMWLNF
jgi:hypothetical protein